MNYKQFKSYVKEHGITLAKTTKKFDKIPKGTKLWFGYYGSVGPSTFPNETENKNDDFNYSFNIKFCGSWYATYKGNFELVDQEPISSPKKFKVKDLVKYKDGKPENFYLIEKVDTKHYHIFPLRSPGIDYVTDGHTLVYPNIKIKIKTSEEADRLMKWFEENTNVKWMDREDPKDFSFPWKDSIINLENNRMFYEFITESTSLKEVLYVSDLIGYEAESITGSPKYKVGDRVRIVAREPGNDSAVDKGKNGDIGYITDYNNLIALSRKKIDKEAKYYMGWFKPSEIEPAPETATEVLQKYLFLVPPEKVADIPKYFKPSVTYQNHISGSPVFNREALDNLFKPECVSQRMANSIKFFEDNPKMIDKFEKYEMTPGRINYGRVLPRGPIFKEDPMEEMTFRALVHGYPRFIAGWHPHSIGSALYTTGNILKVGKYKITRSLTKKSMLQRLGNALKRKLKSEDQALYKANLIDGNLELTPKGVNELLDVVAVKFEKEFVERAREIIKEEKAHKKGDDVDETDNHSGSPDGM